MSKMVAFKVESGTPELKKTNSNKKHHHHLEFDLANRRGHLLAGLAPDIDKRGMS